MCTQKNVVILMMRCHDNVACCFFSLIYIWKMTFFILCVRCWVSVFHGEIKHDDDGRSEREKEKLDINFGWVSGFYCKRAEWYESEKLKRRQSTCLVMFNIKFYRTLSAEAAISRCWQVGLEKQEVTSKRTASICWKKI